MRSLVNTLMNFMFIILHYYNIIMLTQNWIRALPTVMAMSGMFTEHPKVERELDGGEIRLPEFLWLVDEKVPQCVTRYVI